MAEDQEQRPQEYQKKYNKIVAKSWLDPVFKRRLIDNPAKVLKEEGIDVPEGVEVKVLESTEGGIHVPEGVEANALQPPEGVQYLRLPPKPPLSEEELPGEQLAHIQVAPRYPYESTNDIPTFSMKKPKLANHLYVRPGSPDDSGKDVLFFNSERRQIKLEGQGLNQFNEVVIPLLNGRHTKDDIQAKVSHLFPPEDLKRSLQLLSDHNLLQDAEQDSLNEETGIQLAPQLNFFHELDLSPHETQRRLAKATVTIFGMGGAGAAASLSLAGAQVGTIRCVDALPVAPSDPFLAPTFSKESVGSLRAEVIASTISALTQRVNAVPYTDTLETDDDVFRAIEGSDFVVCCADAGLASLFYKVNRACLRARVRWTSCSVSAFEGIVGPTVEPFETACYLCYQMRAAACAEHPEEAVSRLEFLDARKHDDSGVRENLTFTAGAIGNLVGLEAFKTLTGVIEPSTLGHIVVVNLLNLESSKHLVLRKPWCPACFEYQSGAADPLPHQ
jgi:adenylyltransferase/sulfurtransferase